MNCAIPDAPDRLYALGLYPLSHERILSSSDADTLYSEEAALITFIYSTSPLPDVEPYLTENVCVATVADISGLGLTFVVRTIFSMAKFLVLLGILYTESF